MDKRELQRDRKLMSIQLFRIDDRLIHGQVVIGWANYLKSKRIVLCDNSVCENDWEKELYLSIVPPQLKADIVSAQTLAEMLRDQQQDFGHTIILVNSPRTIEDLLGFNAPIERVNVGGIHFKEGREKFLTYLYLAADEIASFKQLFDYGIECYCQDMPNSKAMPLKEILAD